jgi:AraC-like DNA-binding protein
MAEPLPDRLRGWLDLLVESLDEHLDGEEVARRAYLSRYHFDRLISAAAGEPPARLRRRLLLERAGWRLLRGRESITEIGAQAGYATPGAFARAFGRSFGTTPSAFRCEGLMGFRLPTRNGIHFHPPGGVGLPGAERGGPGMDLTERLIEHDLWLTERILERAAALSDGQLDGPIDTGSTWVHEVAPTTLRDVLDRLVFTKETWTASIEGRSAPDDGDRSVEGMRRRLAAVGPQFRRVVQEIGRRVDWDVAFVDALCDPPETFTLGGAIAHVITFSAHRRELAIGVLRSLEIDGLGYGDPIEWERARLDGEA